MKTNENETASTGRHVIGVRALPGLKRDLAEEASQMGITLSEYCESLLANRHAEGQELDELNSKLQAQQTEIEELKRQLVTKTAAPKLPNIFSDERLLNLFNALKGKSDTVDNAYGDDFSITYNSPEEVLKAIVYSSKLKV